MKNMHDFLFHYNQYTGLWAAFRRADQKNYMDKMHPNEGSRALFSKDFIDLVIVIEKGEFPHEPRTESIFKLVSQTDETK